MTRYFKNAEAFFPQSESVFESIHDKLPPGNFVIRLAKTGFYFAKYDKDFQIEGKIYGDTDARADRVINTFLDRPTQTTGVLLSGEKGSGKTLLGKRTCQLLRERHGIPTIFITEPWSGDAFLELIGSIDQPAVLFIDEFEKVYDGENSEQHGNHNQAGMLTLLDGVFTTQKLVILTCNDKHKIDSHMINRPGRIYYSFHFKGLGDEFVREYCADNLRDQQHTDGVVKVGDLFREFNFDMLKAIVEEVNRYGEKPMSCLDYLNVNPEADYAEYKVLLFPHGMSTPLQQPQPAKIKNPIGKQEPFTIYTYELRMAKKGKKPAVPGKKWIEAIRAIDGDDDEQTYVQFKFSARDITQVTGEGYELVNADGDKLVLVKQEDKFDWRAL